MTKVLFLDVDGVVCIKGKLMVHLLQRLQTIIAQTEAKIVLSSNWRLEESYRERIINVLSKYGIQMIDWTESIEDVRPYEIFRWVKKNRPEMCVILDDRSLHKENSGFRIEKFFIQTNTSVGITPECVRRAIFMLNNYSMVIDTKLLIPKFIYNKNHVRSITPTQLWKIEEPKREVSIQNMATTITDPSSIRDTFRRTIVQPRFPSPYDSSESLRYSNPYQSRYSNTYKISHTQPLRHSYSTSFKETGTRPSITCPNFRQTIGAKYHLF